LLQLPYAGLPLSLNMHISFYVLFILLLHSSLSSRKISVQLACLSKHDDDDDDDDGGGGGSSGCSGSSDDDTS
jgi:hypothetical protein